MYLRDKDVLVPSDICLYLHPLPVTWSLAFSCVSLFFVMLFKNPNYAKVYWFYFVLSCQCSLLRNSATVVSNHFAE